MKGIFSFILEIAKTVILALIIVVPIRYFIFQPFVVKGISMTPAFENGDYLIVDEITYRFKAPQRGEVIVFHYPQNTSERFIKRIIGLPGEKITITNGLIEIIDSNGKDEVLAEDNYIPSQNLFEKIEISLPDNEYFVLGDNRLHSFDSRSWGSLPKDYIIGRVVARAWPFNALALISAPQY